MDKSGQVSQMIESALQLEEVGSSIDPEIFTQDSTLARLSIQSQDDVLVMGKK